MIKLLSKSIREFRKESLLAPLFVTLEVVMEVIIPVLIAALMDKGIDGGSMSAIWYYGALLAVSAILSLIFGGCSGHFAAIASAGFARNLRHDMYYKVQEYSFSNIDKFSTASIVTRLTTDVTNVQNAYQMLVRIAVRAPVMMVASLVMAFLLQPTLASVFLVGIVIVGFVLFYIATHVHPVFEKVFRIYDKLNSVVQENLRGIRVVKSYVREDHEVEKFDKVSQDIYKNFTRAEKMVAFNAPTMQFAIYSCMICISWFAANFIVAGSMTTGQLTTMISYAMQILMNLMMLSMVFVMVTMAKSSTERIVELMLEEPDIRDPEDPVHEVADGSISFRDVSFSYAKDPNKLALRDVNLEIASGETVGIIGGTGAAKSSLVQLIPRLYDVTCGQLLVGGKDVRAYGLEDLRNEVAMVLQKNELFSGTIKENLRWGNEHASDEELIRACQLAQADEFIQRFPKKYDTYIEQGGTNVSGGQKQRLCIARALLKKPKILILDDSTSAVDTKTDALIRQAFLEEIPHTTKIIIAQRVSSVQDADKIVVMDGGRIDAVGTHEELLKSNQIYREVYESQQKGGSEHDA